ncbi:MAG: caspase family protein [Rhizobiales bacterium]|nr:caspase family protein [Hyphomicrobiales bacterium]
MLPRFALLLAFPAGLLAASPVAAADRLYGLVVGIDDYRGTVNDLKGAVNDARDIAAALRDAGATDVRLLTDGAATKAAIHDAWLALVKEAVPGDTIVFSYAGHGGQEPEPAGRDGEADHLNENFILANYEPSGPNSLERIVDDEMNEWLKVADDKGIEVVFVADSCHSGTMTRGIGKNVVRYRTGTFADPDLAGDLLKLPDPEAAAMAPQDFKNVTFIAATQDNMLTPELMIDGEVHGALSWAFARAVRGAADANGDGHLSQQELLAYLVPTVEAEAENQQQPGIEPLRPVDRPIMRAMTGSKAAAAPAEGPPLRLFIRGDVPARVPLVPGVILTTDESEADLIWDRAAGTVDHRIGGRVAEHADDAAMPAILSKWSAIAFIKERTAADPVALSVPSGGQVYGPGDVVDLAMTGERLPYLTLFNLPPDGRVEFFWPQSDEETATDWRGRPFSEHFRVDRPPYGAEHIVAVLTAEPALALHASLKAMPTADRAGGLAATLRSILGDSRFQAGLVSVYTKGNP